LHRGSMKPRGAQAQSLGEPPALMRVPQCQYGLHILCAPRDLKIYGLLVLAAIGQSLPEVAFSTRPNPVRCRQYPDSNAAYAPQLGFIRAANVARFVCRRNFKVKIDVLKLCLDHFISDTVW